LSEQETIMLGKIGDMNAEHSAELNAKPIGGAMDQAIYICSSDGIVQYFNQLVLDYTELPKDVVYIGARRSDVFEFIAKRGDLGPGEHRGIAAERQKCLARDGAFRFQRQTPSGLTLDIRQQITPSGELISTYTDITAARRLESAVTNISAAASHSIGQGFMQNLTNALSRALEMKWVMIAVPDGAESRYMTTIAASEDGKEIGNLRFPIQGGPSAYVVGQGITVHQRGAYHLFPENKILAALKIESYVGARLFDPDGRALGVLAAFDVAALPDDHTALPVMEIFAAHAAGELNRLLSFEKQQKGEQRFRNFAEIGSDWLWEIDADLCFSWMADKVEAITGLPPSYYIGKSRHGLRTGDNDPELWAKHMETLHAHKPFKDFQIKRKLPNGRTIWIRSSGKPMFDDEGDFQGYFGASSDITDEIEAGREARSSNERLATAIGGTGDPVALYDADDCLVICNDAYRGLHPDFTEKLHPGISFQDVARIFANIGDGVLPYDVDDRMQRHREARQPYELAHPNGRWYQVVDRRLSDGGTIILGVDITEQKNTEGKLRDARDRAESANRAKSRFLASVSHELRTPLNAIIGFSEIIGTEMFGAIDNPAYVQYGKDIQGSGQLLLGLISDILDLSQIDAEEMTLKEQAEDVAALVEECVHLFQKRASEVAIKFSVNLQGAPTAIIVDGRRIKQILVNLIGNSMKFTPAGGSIHIGGAITKEGWITLSVRDSGIGMAAADIERALQPFSQLETNTFQEQDGVGLGLSIASRLAALHGGRLKIESEPGAGTLAQILGSSTFQMELNRFPSGAAIR